MRVTIVSLHYAPEPTGNAPYVADLAAGIVEHGHQVTVVTSHPFYPQWRRYAEYGPDRTTSSAGDLLVVRRPHYIPHAPSAWRRLVSELSGGLAALREGLHDADVVILVSPALFHASVVSLAMRRRPRRTRTPWAVWVQDLYSLGIQETSTAGGAVASIVGKVESNLLRSADHVIAIHERFANYISADLGVDERRVSTVRNWSHVRAARGRQRDRDSLGWGSDDFVIVHAGNQGLKQGLDNVIDAARIAEADGLPLRFVLLGDGNQRARLQETASDLSLVQFIDPLPDEEFLATLSTADALLVNELPSLRDMSVPSKLTTYFSTGLPVIAATHPDSVTAGEIGLSGGGVVVPAGDPQSLVDAAMRLRADPQMRNRLGEQGLVYRESKLGRTVAVSTFNEIVRRLARKP